jgi:hypothetical protein
MNWRELNRRINDLTEEQLLDMLAAEAKGPRRVSIITRLHQRYTILRAARERKEWLNAG